LTLVAKRVSPLSERAHRCDVPPKVHGRGGFTCTLLSVVFEAKRTLDPLFLDIGGSVILRPIHLASQLLDRAIQARILRRLWHVEVQLAHQVIGDCCDRGERDARCLG
jgi:hypothetical protein